MTQPKQPADSKTLPSTPPVPSPEASRVIAWRNQNDGRDGEFSALTTWTDNGGPSLTVQSMADETDVNKIVERYASTGQLPQTGRQPMFGDFTQITDFRGALEAVKKAQEDFMTLPPAVRGRFDNDPQKLLEFVMDDRNMEEAGKLGLLIEQPPQAETKRTVQDQPPNTSKV